MIKVAICDDNEKIVNYVESVIDEHYKNKCIVSKFLKGEDVQKAFLIDKPFDVLITDIDLVSINGISMAENLKKIYHNLKIIFMTGYIDFCNDIFETSPSYFLTKPIKPDKLLLALNKVFDEVENNEGEFVSVKLKNSISKLKIKNIKFVESLNRQIYLHSEIKTHAIYQKLDEIEELLPENFIRCHKSYIVNLDFVKSMQARNFILFDDTAIPISQSKFKKTKDKFLEIIDGKL